MQIVWAVLLAVAVSVGWLLNLIGMPGNWMIVVAAGAYAWLMPVGPRVSMGWPVVGMLLVLALLGELIEFVAGAIGATKAGGSRRGAVLALVGGLVGGIVGIFVGVPVPLVGPILAALLFAGIGALVGAMAGEAWAGRAWTESWRVGKAAFWGRLLGTLGKIVIGSIMVAVTLVAILI